MARKRKFEDKCDPEHRRAPKGVKFPVKEDGETEGSGTVWDIEYGKSLVLVEWNDGEITSYIQECED